MSEQIVQINIRLSPEDLAKIDTNAKEAGLSRAAFIRLTALNSKVRIVPIEKGQ